MARPRAQVERGAARGRRIVAELCGETETVRSNCGLAYAELGRAVGLSGEQVARILRGQSPNVSLLQLAVLMAAVGLDLSARAYPAGPPVRDAAHLALLGRLRLRIGPSLTWRAEVPVVNAVPPSTVGAVGFAFGVGADQRAWDATISGRGWTVGVEAETRIRDVQGVERRLSLKQRDGSVESVILLVGDSAHNRAVLSAADARLRQQLPASQRLTLRRLGLGQQPLGATIVVL